MLDILFLVSALCLSVALAVVGFLLLNWVASEVLILFPELADKTGGPSGMRKIVLGITIAAFIMGMCL